MWWHSCICLEVQRKFTEDTCEDKPSLIPELNSGSSLHEAELTHMDRNFLFYIQLISILCHVINTWYLSPGKCLSCHWPPNCSMQAVSIQLRKLKEFRFVQHRALKQWRKNWVVITCVFIQELPQTNLIPETSRQLRVSCFCSVAPGKW
jgi:hypothetical protein